jgi:uncharacterized membrane protein
MSDVFSLGLGIVAITLVSILVITGLSVGLIFWVFRRAMKSPGDQAKAELDRRLADGEISPVEYEARLDAIRNSR